jgi:hypothetical protein
LVESVGASGDDDGTAPSFGATGSAGAVATTVGALRLRGARFFGFGSSGGGVAEGGAGVGAAGAGGRAGGGGRTIGAAGVTLSLRTTLGAVFLGRAAVTFRRRFGAGDATGPAGGPSLSSERAGSGTGKEGGGDAGARGDGDEETGAEEAVGGAADPALGRAGWGVGDARLGPAGRAPAVVAAGRGATGVGAFRGAGFSTM